MSKVLTTHTGSLPRSQEVVDFIFAREKGTPYDQAGFDDTMSAAVAQAVTRQKEVGIDISHEQPKVLTTLAVEQSDVVITMGCGDACPFFPGKRYLDWPLDDPAGQGVVHVRPIRDEIKKLVEDLIPTLFKN